MLSCYNVVCICIIFIATVSLTEDTVKHWIEEDKSVVLASNPSKFTPSDWRMLYYNLLQSYYFTQYVKLSSKACSQ